MRTALRTVVMLGMTLATCGALPAQNSGGPANNSVPILVRLDARAPWEAEGAEELHARPDDTQSLVVTVGPQAARTLRIRLRMASVAEVARRWPVGLREQFEVTLDFAGVSADHQPVRAVPYYTDARWRTHTGLPVALDAAAPSQRLRLSLPAAGADDLTELGIDMDWSNAASPTSGEISIFIDRLVLQAAARHDPPSLPEGTSLISPGSERAWRTDPAYHGVESVLPAEGATTLRCNLDWRDRSRGSGVVWVDVTDAGRATDMSDRGVFATVRCSRSAPAAPLFSFRVRTGLRDADGKVFWGQAQDVVADDSPTTVGTYPETRFPLPLGFQAEGFDPARVSAVGLRLDVLDDKRRTFVGAVTVERFHIVAMPDELRARNDRIAEHIGRANWLNRLRPRATALPAAPVPIATFCDNLGVDYPWPYGVYPGVGQRLWNPSAGGFSHCADLLARDFEYLTAHRVRMIRVFIFCDARTGIVADGRGGLPLDSLVRPDIRALLQALEKFETLRLIPVLFDFNIADGIEREDFGLVGEHPDWLTEADKRRALLDAVQPAIELLAAHPQVAAIDLMNEPEHAAAVGIDDMWVFLAELAERVHRSPRHVPCTVGSANALCAPFWLPTGIDFPSCHWFAKIDATHPLGQRAAALDPAVALMTEIDPGVGVETALLQLWQAGFRGGLFWSLNGADAYEFRGEPAEAFQRWTNAHLP